MNAEKLFSTLWCTLLLLSAAAQSNKTKMPEPRKDVTAPVDSSWEQFLAGDKIFSNGELFDPAGKSLSLNRGTRILNLEFAKKRHFLVSKSNRGLTVIDANSFTVADQFGYEKEAGSMYGLSVDDNDSTVYFTGAKRNLYIGNIGQSGGFTLTKKLDLSIDGKTTTTPLGIGLCNNIAFVALAIPNQIAVVDVAEGKVLSKIPVGVCPYAVIISKDKKYAFISNFGGPHPKQGDRTEISAGTEVAVAENSVALRGSVSVIDVRSRKVIAEVATRIHPESMTLSPDGASLYVCDDSGDGISVIDTKTFKTVRTINTKPDVNLPYGSLTTALAFSPDGKVLYTANAGNNSIALIDPNQPGKVPYGFIAAGGFPGAVCATANDLFIGNVTPLRGALQKVSLPKSKAELDAYTAQAKKGFHFIEILRAQAEATSDVKPQPVPDYVGGTSPIKHVVYIIRENKKYDQELGDIGKGNSNPVLVYFPDSVTPNAHSLARQYVLLDNYYCNGVNSSDGHQWATQGITSPYHEKDFSGGRCAYDFGTDPLCYAGCGFIWDHLLRKGISFRNFGEFDFPVVTKGKTWSDLYNGWKSKNDSVWFKCKYDMGTLEQKYSDLRFPGWNMMITDQIRADRFIDALQEYEAKGSLPEFIVLYIPNDHGTGYGEDVPTPRACVADNDLATGRAIEALSKSSFWKDMAIFVNEDDPQSGIDHVDAHRSVCYVAGPYVKRNTVVSKFYNQASVLHTICQIFGVQPMNQLVAMAPLMTDCFNETPDYTPFTCRTPAIAVNEMNPPKEKLSKTTRRLAPLTREMDFSKPDLIDKDALLFSKYVWSTIYGDKPFPKKYFGIQKDNLRALGLQIDTRYKDND
jgi:YVTN family beta-propeller protein